MKEIFTVEQEIEQVKDWLISLPDEELDVIYLKKRVPHGVDFRWNTGGTEYTVVSHFNQNAKDDIFHKLLRLLEKDVLT